MPDFGLVLGETAAKQVGEAVRRVSGRPWNDRPPTAHGFAYPGGDTAVVLITAKRCGKYYPARGLAYDHDSHTWGLLAECWAFGPNDESLKVGKRYVARRISYATTTTTPDPALTTTSTTPACTTTTTTSSTTTTTPVPTTTTTTTWCPPIPEGATVYVVTGELDDFNDFNFGPTTTLKPCLGLCEWECDMAVMGGKWTQVANSCCLPCVCTEPKYCCGLCSGVTYEKTKTVCAQAAGKPQPSCPTTTTTTTPGPGTTTTTPGPTTTTTYSPSCTSCVFVCASGSWVKTEDGCPSLGCPMCPFPTGSCTECDVISTGCTIPNPTTTAPPFINCFGTCKWIQTAFGWTQDLSWKDGCNLAATNGCVCEQPSYTGACGGTDFTVCHENTPPTTTTTGTGTTTTAGPTTTTTWTTTTSGPLCNGVCRFKWVVSVTDWVVYCTNCPSGCVCGVKPAYAGTSDDETAEMPCKTTTTTTSTSTTTTTTTCPPGAGCMWIHSELTESCHWVQIGSNTCSVPCYCCPPSFKCGAPFVTYFMPCNPFPCVTTTTGTSTSSTTVCPNTTTTPEPGCASNGCVWQPDGATFPCSWVLFSNACSSCPGCDPPPCPPVLADCEGSFFTQTACTGNTTTTVGP